MESDKSAETSVLFPSGWSGVSAISRTLCTKYPLHHCFPEHSPREWPRSLPDAPQPDLVPVKQASKQLRSRLEEIRRLNSAAIKAKLTGELSAEDLDSLKTTNAADAAEIERQLSDLESQKSMMQQLIEQSERELVDLVNAWKRASITGKKELQSALFHAGLVWGHESGFLNPRMQG